MSVGEKLNVCLINANSCSIEGSRTLKYPFEQRISGGYVGSLQIEYLRKVNYNGRKQSGSSGKIKPGSEGC